MSRSIEDEHLHVIEDDFALDFKCKEGAFWGYYDQYLSVEVKSTQEGGVEDEDSTEKFLVEPEVTDLDQDVVVGHRERFFSKD